jgi:DNA-binding MarR family transcriptional regulator
MNKRHANFHLLLHSADLLEKHLVERLVPLGIRPRQARVLVAINALGSTSQVALAKEFDLTKGSMSTMIDRLLALELVARQKSETDRRGDILTLTPIGERMLAEIYAAWRDMDGLLETSLGLEKAATLAAMTSELRTALGGATPASKSCGPKKSKGESV